MRWARTLARRSACAALTACALTACAPMLAAPGDQAAYRSVRLSPTLERRVVAAQRYLSERPEGAYRARVEAYFRRAEPVFFAIHRADEEGLATYLGALPRGPHADEARARLAALARARARGDALEAEARKTDAKLAAQAAGRKRARDAFARWVRLLVDPASYAGPIAEGPAELVQAFALELPEAECSRYEEPLGDVVRRCDKRIELSFELPGGALGRQSRSVELSVLVDQDATGRPRHATVSGEELFVRLEEAESLAPIDGTDAAARARATERAAAIVRSLVAGWAGGSASCERPLGEGEAYRAACSGLEIVVLAAGGGLDVVEITASSP